MLFCSPNLGEPFGDKMLDLISVINYLAIMNNLKKLKELRCDLNKDTHIIEIEYIDMVISYLEKNKTR